MIPVTRLNFLRPAAAPITRAALCALAFTAPLAGAQPMLHPAADAGGSRLVKGAPYCADAVHEDVQWLADPAGGAPNRVSNKRTTRLCRDGEGRTRQEVERGGRKVVYLHDPGTRESWVLDPERKTYRSAGSVAWFDDAAMREQGERMREYAQRMREWAREFSERMRSQGGGPGSVGGVPPTPPAPPSPPTPPSPPSPVAAGAAPAVIAFGPGGEREIDVRVMRFDGPPGDFPAPPMPAALRGFAPRGPGAVTPLPAREIEGLRVNGERTTWTIEAGKIGNDKPIQIVREVWTSPELMLTVASRDFDPRSSETLYRLQNVRRGEPDAALMRVPADYTQARRTERERAERTDKPADKGEKR